VKILMDLDGVLCEWVRPAAAAFGLTYDELIRRWPRGSSDIESALLVTKDEMWAAIDALGEGFWADLPETPWARRLYDGARKVGPVTFLTSPSHHPSSLAGKLTWMQRFTGNSRFRDYLIGPRKEMCAGPESVLVDDHDGNLAKFAEAGGHAICVPRVWNKMHDHDGDPCDYVLSRLAAFASVPATDQIGKALALLEAESDRMRACMATLYEASKGEMEDIILNSKEPSDLKSFLSGVAASIAKEEHLKRRAGERFMSGR
jgi:5'(3')-deoxyribonucleotidase